MTTVYSVTIILLHSYGRSRASYCGMARSRPLIGQSTKQYNSKTIARGSQHSRGPSVEPVSRYNASKTDGTVIFQLVQLLQTSGRSDPIHELHISGLMYPRFVLPVRSTVDHVCRGGNV